MLQCIFKMFSAGFNAGTDTSAALISNGTVNNALFHSADTSVRCCLSNHADPALSSDRSIAELCPNVPYFVVN